MQYYTIEHNPDWNELIIGRVIMTEYILLGATRNDICLLLKTVEVTEVGLTLFISFNHE